MFYQIFISYLFNLKVTNSVTNDADKIERISAELLGKMKFLEDQQSEKNKSQKKLLKDLEDL